MNNNNNNNEDEEMKIITEQIYKTKNIDYKEEKDDIASSKLDSEIDKKSITHDSFTTGRILRK